MSERQRFEIWADTEGLALERRPSPYTSSDDRNGRYVSDSTEYSWQAWQARAAVQPSGAENQRLTKRQLVEKFRRGERITKADAEGSMFDAEDAEKAKQCGYRHSWRCIVCWDSEADIDECRNCGRQAEHACNFDEDMS